MTFDKIIYDNLFTKSLSSWFLGPLSLLLLFRSRTASGDRKTLQIPKNHRSSPESFQKTILETNVWMLVHF